MYSENDIYTQFREKYLNRLNEQQRAAVQGVEGPVLLLAVPGSGKTTVLITRLGYMIYCKGIDPKKILTVTYTVAATKDMSKRFASYFGEEMADQLEFRTINGICAKIIQYYGRKVGKAPFELVKDEKTTAGMLSQIFLESEHSYATESDLKNVRTLITYIKNMMLTEKEILKLEEQEEIRISVIYKEYCRQLREQGMMDYDDQMLYAYNMLRRFPELLAHFHNMYPYICVDEAQDTSKIQHAIIALLSSKTENLFMVGDEDQSIYGFRAAYPEALLLFEKHHPNAKVLLMEENFRSNAKIVAAADRFIQKNTLRHEKHMKATRPAAEDLKEITLKSRKAQYTYLAKIADGCTTETAVLYRDNECVLPLVDLLERKKIPYQMRSKELTFFTHRTVVDIVNIIRFAMNPKDTELFLQIYYKLGMFLKKQDAIRIVQISEEKDMTVLDAAISYGNLDSYIAGKVKATRSHLRNLLNDPADKAVNRIVKFMGYQEYLNRSGIRDSKIELLKTIGSREDSPQRLIERLEELKYIMQEKERDYDCPFILSTIHASKGLEYDTVYLMDVVDGIFPEKIPMSLKNAPKEEIETYEEERRLFYVGATRAKDRLVLFTMNRPGSFATEMLGKMSVREKNQTTANTKSQNNRKQKNYYANSNVYGMKQIVNDKYDKFIEKLGAGVIVKHKMFGRGVVVNIDEEYVQIQFGDVLKIFNLRIVAGGGMIKVEE